MMLAACTVIDEKYLRVSDGSVDCATCCWAAQVWAGYRSLIFSIIASTAAVITTTITNMLCLHRPSLHPMHHPRGFSSPVVTRVRVLTSTQHQQRQESIPITLTTARPRQPQHITTSTVQAALSAAQYLPSMITTMCWILCTIRYWAVCSCSCILLSCCASP